MDGIKSKHCIMNRKEILDSIGKTMYERIHDSIVDEQHWVEVEFETDTLLVEVFADSSEYSEVNITLYDGRIRDYKNIKEAIIQCVPAWSDVESDVRYESADEFQQRGFRDAADYYEWRFGRGFGR